MTTLHMVWEGEFEDRTVVAVCSSRREAEAMLAENCGKKHSDNIYRHEEATGDLKPKRPVSNDSQLWRAYRAEMTAWAVRERAARVVWDDEHCPDVLSHSIEPIEMDSWSSA